MLFGTSRHLSMDVTWRLAALNRHISNNDPKSIIDWWDANDDVILSLLLWLNLHEKSVKWRNSAKIYWLEREKIAFFGTEKMKQNFSAALDGK